MVLVVEGTCRIAVVVRSSWLTLIWGHLVGIGSFAPDLVRCVPNPMPQPHRLVLAFCQRGGQTGSAVVAV